MSDTGLIDSIFTFHYVSIKTIVGRLMFVRLNNLHSTMYLLKPLAFVYDYVYVQFTFHYVSIKTSCASVLAY